MINFVDIIKNVPDTWLICFTVLVMPSATGLGIKIASTEFISFSRGDTQIEFGDVVKESDRLINELAGKNDELLLNNLKLQAVVDERNIKIPGLKKTSVAIQESESLTTELKLNNEKLQDIVDEQMSNSDEIK